MVPALQQKLKLTLSQSALHLPASQNVFVAQDPGPLHTTPASPPPPRTEPLSQVPCPVHSTIEVPSERAETGCPTHELRPEHPTSHSWVASHLTPCAQEPGPLQRTVHVFALQVTALVLQLLSPTQPTLHAPASHWTPFVHVPSPVQATLHATPLHSMGLVVHEFSPEQPSRHAAADEQSIPFVQAPSRQLTSQGMPCGHWTVFAVQVPASHS